MIQAQDLRIGNLVMTNNSKYRTEDVGKIACITQIDSERTFEEIKGTASLYLIDNKWKDTYGQWLTFLEPIPINEEWLLKFGFIRQDNDIDTWYQIEIKDGYYLEYFISMSYTSLILIEVNNITGDNQFILPNTPKFVHELQNIYYALTQKELEYVGAN